MKKPLSDISLTTAVRTLTAIIGFLLSHFLCMAQEPVTSGNGMGYQPNDTINAIVPLPDSDEESFLRGVIPPPPNAAALARYAEYPVSHTTGIPDISIPLYEIQMGGFTLQGVRSVDEDGNEMTVYSDRLGRKVLERRGPESEKGQNDTYFVYNDLGQLRYVLSPGYELSGYKEKFAYEYRYDESGNVVKKFIRGGGYTQYWYDRAGRMTFMQDPGLREQGLHRFFLYDKGGRQVIQGLSSSCNCSETVSVKRGDTNKVGTVSYKYNLHGQATSISGPGFSQTLHYTDGPGKPLYNGSVSAMTWTMGSDGVRRGYKYSYNGYGWLTLAEYAEGETLTSNKDRYTERFLNFMPNGGIRRLQRHGLKADGNYGSIDMVQFPGGYATISGSTVTFHYYTQDYLGNNRAVVNGTTGAIEQTTAYYPYGAVIADLGIGNSGQSFKFGGKELISANGLNEYGFGARHHYPAIPQFTSIDPLCEKYPWLSPYLYCANNPINAVDTDGKLIIFINGMHFGDGGSSKYWNGVDNTLIQLLNDNHTVYIDGSFGGHFNTILTGLTNNNLITKNRIKLGYNIGISEAEEIYSNLSENETIKIITHSMGGATGKGIADALLEYAQSVGVDSKIDFELDLAPYKWEEQIGNPLVDTYTISHWHDRVAGPSFMKNAKNFRTHEEASKSQIIEEHQVTSFEDEIIKLINDGQIKVNIYY